MSDLLSQKCFYPRTSTHHYNNLRAIVHAQFEKKKILTHAVEFHFPSSTTV